MNSTTFPSVLVDTTVVLYVVDTRKGDKNRGGVSGQKHGSSVL